MQRHRSTFSKYLGNRKTGKEITREPDRPGAQETAASEALHYTPQFINNRSTRVAELQTKNSGTSRLIRSNGTFKPWKFAKDLRKNRSWICDSFDRIIVKTGEKCDFYFGNLFNSHYKLQISKLGKNREEVLILDNRFDSWFYFAWNI